MAMPTGDGVLALAVQKLSDFIIQEATFILGVKDDVEWVRRELTVMRSFLKDAEQKQDADNRIRWWVAEIRSIAKETVAIIDAYSKEVKGKEPSTIKLLKTSAQKAFCMASESNVYDIGKEIKALKERLSDISRKRIVYGIKSIGNAQEIANAALQEQRLEALRRTTSDADKEHFIGFDNDLNMLKTQLSSDDKGRRAISILGRGGSGKTTLARKLYHTNNNSFKLHAWVCVSRKWDVKDLLERIINSLKELNTDELSKLEKLKVDGTKRYLRKLLADKQYLVVIDDLWDEEAWEYLKSALPDYQNRSRVIITTRNEFVAGLSDPKTYVHKLRRLRDDESWDLFCKNVFSNQNNVCPQHLEKIGKEMVAMLDGLPLALTVLGGILSREKSYNKWHEVQRSIWKKLKIQSIHISALLDLSFNDLTNELKSCFLYLGIFPEDHKIRSEKLIQLWIAEDLVQQSEGLDLEESAESYLEQLNARSLIQLGTHESTSDSTYRVDNLLRDLAVTKAKEQEIFHIHEEPVNPSTKPFSIRRIVFRSGFEKYMASDHSHSEVHTLTFLNYHSLLDDGNVTKLLTLIKTKFKSLRVLDLEGVKIATTESKLKLLEAIGKVVHLKYLGVFEADIDELPQWIGNLEALQALDVFTDNNKSKLLSGDICKLKQLRHLNGDFATKNGDILVPPTTLEDLKNLQFLHNIDISGWLTDEKSHESALNAFSKLCKIRMLAVSFNTNHGLSIEPLCSCRNLIQLELNGRIKTLPKELHKSLPKLRYLSLHKAQFEQDPLPTLEKLTNLLVLSLDGFLLKSLIITATGFYGLVSLSIRGIHRDMDLQIVEGALPKLRHIHIDPNLTNFTLPERFRDL